MGVRAQTAGMTLAAFCRRFGEALADAPAAEAPARAAALLPALLARDDLLSPAQRTAPETGYGRHCLFACPQDRFSVLAMVWPAGYRSPVHDHATWCVFGIYEGAIEERRYRPGREGRAVETVRLAHRTGEVAHLPLDAPDIHGMCNPADRPTISIHVYGGNARRLGPNVRTVWSVEG